MKVLLIGSDTPVGQALCNFFDLRGTEYAALSKSECRWKSERQAKKAVVRAKADIVVDIRIEAAGDGGIQIQELDIKRCHWGAKASQRTNTAYMFVSSARVFSGRLDRPYREDDMPDEYSYGALILPTGKLVTLGYKEINLQVLNKWKSGVSATEYPATWQLQIPGQHLSLVIEPIIANQELNLSFRYWEGAVNVSGKHDGKNIKGHGYVELTGY